MIGALSNVILKKGTAKIHKFSKMPQGWILIKGKRHSALHFCVNYGAIAYSTALF